MHVVSLSGEKLFSGSRHDCKQFIRKNRIKRFRLKERFVEKVAVVDEPIVVEEEDYTTDSLSYFNKVFDTK